MTSPLGLGNFPKQPINAWALIDPNTDVPHPNGVLIESRGGVFSTLVVVATGHFTMLMTAASGIDAADNCAIVVSPSMLIPDDAPNPTFVTYGIEAPASPGLPAKLHLYAYDAAGVAATPYRISIGLMKA